MTPAVKIYEDLIAKLKERNVIVARAVKFAQSTDFRTESFISVSLNK